jgi:hypothetical protein
MIQSCRDCQKAHPKLCEVHEAARVRALTRRTPPALLTTEEGQELLTDAETLWRDLQQNNLGGFSGANRPFYILWQFRRVIEKYGNRDVGLTWSQDELDALRLNGG